MERYVTRGARVTAAAIALLCLSFGFGDVASADTNLCPATNIKPPENLSDLERKADADNKAAAYFQAVLASLYRRGAIVKVDHQKAKRLLDRAVKSDQSGLAQYEMGLLFEYGYGIEKNLETAIKLYEEARPKLEKAASEDKDPRAQYRLAVLLNEGKGEIEKDEDRAKTLDRLAAEQGHWLAQFRYAGVLENSDPKEAAKWYCVAAQNGYSGSMSSLADFYRKLGREILVDASNEQSGVQQRLDALNDSAKLWYRKAAENNPNPDGWVDFGQRLENGRVFDRNYDEAAAWYRRAADAGLAEGKYRLAMLLWFQLGEAGQQKEEARQYLNAAAKEGHDGAQNMVEYLSLVEETK